MADRQDATRQTGDRGAVSSGTSHDGTPTGSRAPDDHNQLAELLEELESDYSPATADGDDRTDRPVASQTKHRDGEAAAPVLPGQSPPGPTPASPAPPEPISRAAKDPVSETPGSIAAKGRTVEHAVPAASLSESSASRPGDQSPGAKADLAGADPTPPRSTEPRPAEVLLEQLEALLSQAARPQDVAAIDEPPSEPEPPAPADQQKRQASPAAMEHAPPAATEKARPTDEPPDTEHPARLPNRPPAEFGDDQNFRDRLKRAALAGERAREERRAREEWQQRAKAERPRARQERQQRTPARARAPKRLPSERRRSRPRDIEPVWDRPVFTYCLITLVVVAALTLVGGVALLMFRGGAGQEMQTDISSTMPVIAQVRPSGDEEPMRGSKPVAMDNGRSVAPHEIGATGIAAPVPPRQNVAPAGSIDAGTLDSTRDDVEENQIPGAATETGPPSPVPVPADRPQIEPSATAGDRIDPVPVTSPAPAGPTDLAQMPDGGNAAAGQPPPVHDQRTTLAKISNYFNSFRTMEGEFIQVGPRGEQSEGVFAISKPGKIRFRYKPPVQLDVIADGRSVAVLDRRADTQDLYPLSKTPLRYLLSEDIDLTSSAVIDEVRQEADLVSLVINEKSSAIKGKLTLIFDRDSHELRQWIVTDAQGLDTSVAIFNTITGMPPDASQFKIYVSPRSRSRRRE